MNRTRRRRWRVGSAVREGVLNALGVSGRGLFALVVIVLGGCLAVLAGGRQQQALERTLTEQARLGRGTLLFSAADPDDPARISVRSCVGLATVSGVLRAGPVVGSGTDDLIQVGRRIPVVATTRSLVPELGQAEALIGAAFSWPVSRALSSARFGSVEVRQAPALPAALALDAALITLLDPAVASTPRCVAVVDRRADALAMLPLLAAQLDVVGGGIDAQRAVMPQFDPIQEFLDRDGRWIPMLVGVLLAFAGGLQLAFRGGEVAAYRLSGTRRVDLLRILVVEQVVLAGVFLAAAAAAALAVGPTTITASMGLRVLAGCCAWLIVFPLLGVPSLLGNPIALAKSR